MVNITGTTGQDDRIGWSTWIGLYIYLIIHLNPYVEFVERGTGGFFKMSNPNVNVDTLKREWVNNAIVLNIGQAGGIINGRWSNSTLRCRLKLYFKFGQGKPVGHKGGRYIWQILDNSNLMVCWKELPNKIKDPCLEEKELIQNFKNLYKSRPFANLKD